MTGPTPIPPLESAGASAPASAPAPGDVTATTGTAQAAGSGTAKPGKAGKSGKAPRQVTCPICKSLVTPSASAGRCPVCGEQVLPAAAVSREVPVLSPLGRWLADGNWRVVLIVLLVLYQIALFITLWINLAHAHLL